MASFHARSNSFPSQTHPIEKDVENHLERLKASQSSSPSSICDNLASLRNLHDGINNLIQLPLVQQGLVCAQGESRINELLEGSLRLVDLCGFSIDVLRLAKESVQQLESSIRRQADDANAYAASRKKVNKMVDKRIKNLKASNRNASALPDIGKILKEAESLDFMILKSVLVLLSEGKERWSKRSWSLLSKSSPSFENWNLLSIHKARKGMDSTAMLRHLVASEMSIREIEEGLEALFKSLVKTRVSLLNVRSH